MISVGKKPDGSIKDTWRNVDERGHFVVHIAHCELAKPVSDSAASLPHGESELKQLQLETIPFEEGIYSLPRLKDCHIAFDATKIDPLSRLGGIQFGLFGDVISVPRPK